MKRQLMFYLEHDGFILSLVKNKRQANRLKQTENKQVIIENERQTENSARQVEMDHFSECLKLPSEQSKQFLAAHLTKSDITKVSLFE